MQTVTTIGLNIAKSGFQVHGIDAAGLAAVSYRGQWRNNRRTASIWRIVGGQGSPADHSMARRWPSAIWVGDIFDATASRSRMK